MKLRKRIALVTVLVIVMNLFAPYSVLFNNTVQAVSSTTIEEYPVIFNNLGITTKGANKILTIQLAVVTETLFKGLDLHFKTDSTKLKLCNRNTGAALTMATQITMGTKVWENCPSTFQVKTYDPATGKIVITTTEPQGGTDIADGMFCIPGQFADNWGDPELDEISAGYPVYYPMINFYFKVMDDSITEDNITMDMFELLPEENGLTTGAKIVYNSTNDKWEGTLGSKGFATPEKEIDNIQVTKDPTKTTYEQGDSINLAGGKLTINYTEGDPDIIDLDDPAVSIVSGDPADVSNPTVKIRYKGKEATFSITVNDPITDFQIKTPPNDVNYDHGETVNFTGMTFEITRKSTAKETLTAADIGSIITVSETVASVDSPKFTRVNPTSEVQKKGTQTLVFTHSGIPSKPANQTIAVNDTISGIDVTKQPNKKVYKRGETLDLTGAEVTVTLGSGTAKINLPDGSVTVSNPSTTTTGSKQELTATLAGHTAPTKIGVEWYDYIKSSELTAPTKWEYKIGDTALDLAGGRLKLTWAGKGVEGKDLVTSSGTITAGITTSALDTTSAGTKTITVTYNVEYTLSDGTKIPDTITKTFEIEVVDAIDRIEITAPSKTTPYMHGETLDEGTINKYYKSAPTKAVTEPWSSATITEPDVVGTKAYTMTPTWDEYGTAQKVDKTLTISYSEDRKIGQRNIPYNNSK